MSQQMEQPNILGFFLSSSPTGRDVISLQNLDLYHSNSLGY